LQKLPEKREVPQEPTLRSRENRAGNVRVTLGRYNIQQPGQYLLKATGDFPETILHLRNSQNARYAIGFTLGFILSSIGAVGTPIFAFFAFRRCGKPPGPAETH